MAKWDEIQVGGEDRNAIDETNALIEKRMARLRRIVPTVVDVSCRECVLTATYGHTLDDKIKLLDLARGIGITDLSVVSFYGFHNVDIQFLHHLVAKRVDMDGLFAFIGEAQNSEEGKPIKPNDGMREVLDAGMPNAIFDVRIHPQPFAFVSRCL